MPQQARKKKKWISLSEAEDCEDADVLTRPSRDPSRAFTHPFASRFAPPAPSRRVSDRLRKEHSGRPHTAAELQELHERQDRIFLGAEELEWPASGRTCSPNEVGIPQVDDKKACYDFLQLGEPLSIISGARNSIEARETSGLLNIPAVDDAAELGNSAKYRSEVRITPSPSPSNLYPEQSPPNAALQNDPRDSGIILNLDPNENHLRATSVKSGKFLIEGSNDMATVPFRTTGDARRPNRYENRPPMSTVLCRNGPQCRKFQEGPYSRRALVVEYCF